MIGNGEEMEIRQMRRRGTFSLRFSIGTAFALIVLFTSLFLGVMTYRESVSFMREDIRLRLHDAAALAAMRIDASAHESIRTREDELRDTYASLKAVLREIRSNLKDVRFVYTMRREGTKHCFVVDAEENSSLVSHVGDEYDTMSPLMIAALDTPGVYVEDAFGSDEWGTWLSSYASIVDDSGRIVGLLGIDISAQRVIGQENRLLMLFVAITLASGLLGIALGVILSRMLSRPLLDLEMELSKIGSFELEGDVRTTSRIAEVVRMNSAVDTMKTGLRSFKKFVPAALVAELIKMGKEAELGAENAELTIFFCDIAGFTTIAEKLTPEELARRLGVYFEGTTKLILESGGTVDKYIGDSIMAFWGAPRPVEAHASKACLAALRCSAFIEKLSQEWQTQGLPPFDTRFGLNSGSVTVGNFGYTDRLNYTAMGDEVNLASRLEGLNKYYGTKIIASESVIRGAGNDIRARKLDVVAVKGKTVGVTVYEVLCERGQESAETMEFISAYEDGLWKYLKRDWTHAVDDFRRALIRRPCDVPSLMMVDRCESLLKAPPPTWNGVFTFDSK